MWTQELGVSTSLRNCDAIYIVFKNHCQFAWQICLFVRAWELGLIVRWQPWNVISNCGMHASLHRRFVEKPVSDSEVK